jgi:hypothetical protein
VPDDLTKSKRKEKDIGQALQRFAYAIAIGAALIAIYAVRLAREGSADFFGVVSVGIMAGGASLMTGGLLGFLFGVPHTRDEGAGESTDASDEIRRETRGPSTTYRPNTSLEQIADWLTKILVGVGLVQIQVIPGKLVSLANYVARGMGGAQASETFALALLVYFTVCGFVFGFLWARLYLPRWFRDADEIQILEEKVNQIERRQATAARALTLMDQLLNRDPDDPPGDEAAVAEAIAKAPRAVRAQMFRQAEAISNNNKVDYYNEKMDGVVKILKGLIKSDTDDRYHRNHSALAYALRRKTPREWAQSESEFTKAIEIRDKQASTGWKSYEFQRARCRIEQDPNFKIGAPSDAASTKRILDDLKIAYSDSAKWKLWYDARGSESAGVIQKWMKLNQLTENTLAQT